MLVRAGLEARLARPVFYELVDLGDEEPVGGETPFGVWSGGMFFRARRARSRTERTRYRARTAWIAQAVDRASSPALGQPGRRGFGGTADPVEAAEVREATAATTTSIPA